MLVGGLGLPPREAILRTRRHHHHLYCARPVARGDASRPGEF